MKATISPAFRDRHGQHGVKVELEATHGGWHGSYSFQTHGLDAEAVAAKRDALELHHQLKADLLTAYHDPEIRADVVIEGEVFTVEDTLVRERGTDVELFVTLKHSSGYRLRLVEVFPTIDDLPGPARLRQRMHLDMVLPWLDQRLEAKSHVQSVSDALANEMAGRVNGKPERTS